MASDASQAEAKSFTPPVGKCNVYIIRRPAFVGGSGLHTVSINGEEAGQLQTGSYLLVSLPPGVYTMILYTGVLGYQHTVNLNASAGKNYFYDDQTSIAIGRARMMPISDEDAMVAVRDCQRVVGNPITTFSSGITQ